VEWIQFLIVVLTIGSFLWMARSDYRHLDAKIDAIQAEIKDFHSRMATQDAEFKSFMKTIEERRNKMIMRE
jgi:peptidoglycan hydrolase CwlO-like protein